MKERTERDNQSNIYCCLQPFVNLEQLHHTLHKRKQISQEPQVHQSKNKNYRQISGTIEKESTSQKNFGQIRKEKCQTDCRQHFIMQILWKKRNVVLFTNSILKTLSMRKFNSCINGGNVQLKSFLGCKAMPLAHLRIPILQEQYYDAAGVHVGINDLLNRSFKISINEICGDINKFL